MTNLESQPQGDLDTLTQLIIGDARNNENYGDVDLSGEISDEVALEFIVRYQNNIINELYFTFNNAKVKDMRKPPYSKLSDTTLDLWENVKREALVLRDIKANPAAFIEKYKSQLPKMKEDSATKTPIRLE